MFIDGHLDLAYVAVQGRDLRVACPDPNVGCVSLPALRDAGVDVALATIYTAPGDDVAGYSSSDALDEAEAAGLRQLEVYETLEREGELSIVRTADDMDDAGPRPAIVILMEGADPIRDPDAARTWFERGLRLVGLTWATGTRYAGGNDGRGGGLTARGVDLVHALDGLGIVHDASHLGDESFDDLLAHSAGPVVATHSNCRALLAPSQRHLRDDQIRAIETRGGIVGLNLYAPFLATGRRATVRDCVDHLEHVAATMTHRRGVGLGSDMDGGFDPGSLPADLDHPQKLLALPAALREAGWSETDVSGFRSGNWERVLRAALP